MLEKKLQNLKEFVKDKGKNGALIAFSGGLDSTTLAVICKDLIDVKLATIVSDIFPASEIEEASKIAKKLGLEHIKIELDLLSDENFIRNPVDRCYYCKKMMIKRLKEFNRVIFEGTNVSDLKKHRPGYKALLEEENVYSPWVEAKITKDEIIQIAKSLGLPIKSPSPCLATRIPFNERITREKLKRIEKAENIIKDISGVKILRVRDHGDLARIEVGKEERKLLCDTKIMDEILRELKALGYKYVTLDLEGYREGSLL
uniref:ATP-dependent sacrificial sulfur transferase LarE n=1 Tax=Geoglobus ahangari TaxID=113653 RepID=A0A7C4S614_9EURY